MKQLVLGTALSLGILTPALGADIFPPYGKAPAPAWTGFYIGVNGGGGWARESFPPFFREQLNNFSPPNLMSGISGVGAIVGGQFGYNWQVHSNLVVGVEADLSGTTISGGKIVQNVSPSDVETQVLDTKIRALGTVRSRVLGRRFDLRYRGSGLGCDST
jgi:outer membrane immunogenic protein